MVTSPQTNPAGCNYSLNVSIGLCFLSPGPHLTFEDEVSVLKPLVKKLETLGVNKIIALGHSGFTTDKEIARRVGGVDIVIGGHSNTFLYTGRWFQLLAPPGCLQRAGGGGVLEILSVPRCFLFVFQERLPFPLLKFLKVLIRSWWTRTTDGRFPWCRPTPLENIWES